ncbi:hypothetical protein PENTCL1PPCAC_13842, partial [Pristionchus entomophagus]
KPILFWPFKSKARKGLEERSSPLTQLFSTFNRIENLVLDRVTKSTIGNNVFDNAISTLGYVLIEKLEVSDSELDRKLQKRIIKLTQKHHIKHVSIYTLKCDQNGIRDFVFKLTKMGATVNIYEYVVKENYYKEVLNYFHRPREFWNNMASLLKKEGVSLSLATIKDDNFITKMCRCNVRTHIICKPIDC